jgi:hypothetical protein
MIVLLGLIILLAAVIIAVAGILANEGSAHTLTSGFSVFGYHVTGSTGTLFLYGVVVGAVAVAGLSLLLAGARRTSRRRSAARRGLRESRQEAAAVSQERDDLAGQRGTARSYTASTPGNGTARSDPGPGPAGSRRGWLRWSRRPAASRPATAESSEPSAGQPAPDVFAGGAPAAPATAGQLTDASTA